MPRMSRAETLYYVLPLNALLNNVEAARFCKCSVITFNTWRNGTSSPSASKRDDLDNAIRKLIRHLKEATTEENDFYPPLIELIKRMELPVGKDLSSPPKGKLKELLRARFVTRTYARPIIEELIAMGFTRTAIYKTATDIGIKKEMEGPNGPNARSFWWLQEEFNSPQELLTQIDDELADGPQTAKNMNKILSKDWTQTQIKQAMKELGVSVFSKGFGENKKSYWAIEDNR